MFSRKVERTAQDYASDARDTLNDAHDQVRGQARELADNAQGTFNNVTDNLREFTLDQPLLALGIAAGVGLLLGRAIGR